jgi:hypothetical protein
MSKTTQKSATIKSGLIISWVIILSMLIPVNQVHAATITVTNTNDSGTGSLRQAITNALSGDTIKFSPSLAGQTILLASQLDITKNLVIDGSGLTPRISISGNNAVRIFNVNSNRIFTLKSLIVRDGKTTGTSYTTFGGALFANSGTTLSIDNTLFTNNSAYSAGAIYLSPSATASITNSEMTGNEANTAGGAIRMNGSGAINFKNNIFSDNVSGGAGAIYFHSGTKNSIIEGNVFENNYALGGGAIYGEMPVSTLDIRSNLFIGNHATGSNQAGGAVYFTAHTIPSLITIENNTFYNNAAIFNGGGAYLGMGPDYYLINNTFSNNMAVTGGNLYLDHGASLSKMYNNIIANQTGGGDCTAFSNTYIVGGSNLIEDGSASCLPNLTGDPGLLSLTNNGGPTQTLALSPSSIAIDAGDNEFCASTDQRGTPRIQGLACDLGAVELDEISPNVISSEPTTGKVLIADAPIQLQVTFNEPMNRYSAEGVVSDPANYLLINDNGDGFQTLSCLDGASSQDQVFSIDEVTYNNTTVTASLKINNNNVLPMGNYQLFVCGTFPALTDIAGNSLNDGLSDNMIAFRVVTISKNSVAENAPAGTSVFTLTAPNGSSFSYNLDKNINGCNGTGNDHFSFDADQLLTTSTFDYETQNIYTLCVVINEAGDLFTQELKVNITDINEIPTDIALSNTTVNENSIIAAQIGVLSTLDSDIYSTFTYDLVNNVTECNGIDNNLFAIAGNSLRTNGDFDYETKNTYTICIRSTDNGGLSITEEFIITVLDTNDAPSNVILTPSSVFENQPGNTIVGYLITIDPDGPTTTSFSSIPGKENCSSTGFNWFTLSNGNEVRTLAPLDYETASSYTLCIRATDSLGARLDKQINIVVTSASLPIVSSIIRTDTNPTNASTVNFSITFSEPVTGVAADDFYLNTTGVTGTMITTVSGSGTTYIVTVNTGSGNGTIRLDVPNTATIKDLSNNDLSGLPFTGASYTIEKIINAPNHTVTFDANGGTGSMLNQVANSPTALTANTFTYSGYSFTGWNTAANGSGTSIMDGEIYPFDADITLYAQWLDTPPLINSITRASTSPASAASVDFTVTFSEDITDLSTVDPFDDFELYSTGVTGAAITAVSGSGSIYTVTVNTGSGNGTIRLDIPDTATIFDSSNNPFIDFPYMEGEEYAILKTTSATLKSSAANDGWILESSETSNTGGTLNSTQTTFNVGDDASNNQYRAILHFDTSALPDTAVVTNMTLKIKQQGNVNGVSPFTFGSLYVDMRNPAFGNAILELGDFNFAAKKVKPAVFNPNPVSGWFSARFNTGGNLYVNRTGTTQLRLYFSVDDNNNNIADFIRFYSGNASAGDRPKLLITYYVP